MCIRCLHLHRCRVHLFSAIISMLLCRGVVLNTVAIFQEENGTSEVKVEQNCVEHHRFADFASVRHTYVSVPRSQFSVSSSL